MKDSTLRLVLFVVIMMFGSMMILFDIPVFYLLVGAVGLGILVLFLTGTIKLPSLKRRTAAEKAAAPKKEEKKRVKEKRPPKEKREKTPGKKGGAGEFFSSLKGAFSVLGRDLWRGAKSKQELETHQKKIDSLLDQSIRGGGVSALDDIIPEAAPAERKKASDPFTALVGEDLNADLLNDIQGAEDFSILDDNELGMNIGPPGQVKGAPGGDVSTLDIGLSGDEAPITLDETNDADEVKEILDAHQGELDMGEDAGLDLPEDAMEGLDGLDLEGIDLEEEGTAPPGPGSTQKEAPAAVGKTGAGPSSISPPGKPDSPKPAAPAFSPEQDMLSFSKGRGQDDDLMASLKADAKISKKSEYASLIRDMKDIRVDASDLQSELESILKPRKPRAP